MARSMIAVVSLPANTFDVAQAVKNHSEIEGSLALASMNRDMKSLEFCKVADFSSSPVFSVRSLALATAKATTGEVFAGSILLRNVFLVHTLSSQDIWPT